MLALFSICTDITDPWRAAETNQKSARSFFFSFERPHTNQLCPHPQNSPCASISLQRPTWTQSKAQILLLPPPPPPQRKVLSPFSLVSLSASLPYQYALAVSPFPLNRSYFYWTRSVWMLQAPICCETLGYPFSPNSNFYMLPPSQ